MYWCRNCRKTISRADMITEEVGLRLPYCPECQEELVSANICDCGRDKDSLEDWCPRCEKVRNDAVMHCFAQIRLNTKLELSSQGARALILSYFEE